MKYHSILFLLLCSFAHAATTPPTQAVIQNKATKAVADSLVIPSGMSITINSGASIINNGTATGFGGSWGGITGTLSAQTDLQSALNAKLSTATAASTYQPIITTGSIALSKLATDPLARANHTGTQAWSTLTSTPTTLAGYGIADAQPLNGNLTTLAAGFGTFFSGMVYWDHITSSFTRVFPIPNSSLTGVGGGGAGGSFSLGSLTIALGDAILASAVRTAILPSKTGNGGKVLAVKSDATDYELITISSGITIGTTAISGGTSGRLLVSGSTVTELTLGTGVTTALGNNTDASGGMLTYGLIGTSGTKIPLLNTTNTWSATQNTRSLIPSTDDTYNVGAQFPGTRFRQGFFSDSVNAQYYVFGGGAYIYPVTFNSKAAFRFNAGDGATGSPILLGTADATHPAIDYSSYTFVFKKGDNTVGGIQTGEITATTYIKLPSYVVSALPSAATVGAGTMAFVTDATVTVSYTTVAGSGSNKVLVISDGTNWIIH